MTLVTFALLLCGVLFNAIAQLCLKAGTNAVGHFEFAAANVIPVGFKIATQPYIVAGLACYVASLVVWILGLSRVPVSVAYPLLSLGYVINALAAWWMFGEDLGAQKLAGIGLIIVGVVLVARS
ncbi:MAG: SMR family transporter [Burkholderiales bacterium]